MDDEGRRTLRDILFISYFTPDGNYEECAARLSASLVKFDIPYTIERREPFPSWRHGICAKPQYIFETLLRRRCPVVWLDIDTEVMKRPELLFGPEDFAVYNWCADTRHHLEGRIAHGPRNLIASGGVLKFGYTAAAIELLARWISAINNGGEDKPLDDPLLSRTFAEWQPPVNPLWLPKSYNRMDAHWKAYPEDQIIINHYCRCGGHRDGVTYEGVAVDAETGERA